MQLTFASLVLGVAANVVPLVAVVFISTNTDLGPMARLVRSVTGSTEIQTDRPKAVVVRMGV